MEYNRCLSVIPVVFFYVGFVFVVVVVLFLCIRPRSYLDLCFSENGDFGIGSVSFIVVDVLFCVLYIHIF